MKDHEIARIAIRACKEELEDLIGNHTIQLAFQDSNPLGSGSVWGSSFTKALKEIEKARHVSEDHDILDEDHGILDEDHDILDEVLKDFDM